MLPLGLMHMTCTDTMFAFFIKITVVMLLVGEVAQ